MKIFPALVGLGVIGLAIIAASSSAAEPEHAPPRPPSPIPPAPIPVPPPEIAPIPVPIEMLEKGAHYTFPIETDISSPQDVQRVSTSWQILKIREIVPEQTTPPILRPPFKFEVEDAVWTIEEPVPLIKALGVKNSDLGPITVTTLPKKL